MRSSAYWGVVAVLLLAAPALAGPVATFTFKDKTEVTAELVAFKGGYFKVKDLAGTRSAKLLDEKEITRIDFGERAVTLNSDGALLLLNDPEDTTDLWWAIDHRYFLILLNTCRQDKDKGTAEFIRVRQLRREIDERLKTTEIDYERERDLRLAEVTVLASMGMRPLARRKLVEIDEEFGDDQVYIGFFLDMWLLRREERHENGELPKQPPRLPRTPGTGRRNERP